MNPITLDFPDQFETERLLIRAPRIGDGALYYRAVSDSMAELRLWMPWAQTTPLTIEAYEIVMRQACANWILRTDLMMPIFNKNGEMVGSSGLHRIDWDVPKFEIGYWGHSAFGGQGLMTEAVRGIADFAFETLGAARVEIQCFAENHRSASLARRVGFTLEATLRNHSRRENQLQDWLIFSQIREANR